jgi:hypothetical protein
MMDASTLVGDQNGYLYIRDALGTGYSAMSWVWVTWGQR